MWTFRSLLLLTFLLALFSTPSLTLLIPTISARASIDADVVIYGGTPAAITAAVQLKRMGKSAVIVSPDEHLGGLTSSGLGWTDSKNGEAIGGIAREFYSAVYNHYLSDAAWSHNETRDEYLDMRVSAQPGPAVDTANKVQWTFEPKVAEYIFDTWVKDQKVEVYRGERLDRSSGGVSKSGAQIMGFKTESGKIFTGKQFIDAGYEGDLMAAAKVSYSVGRESKAAHGESLAGKILQVNDAYSSVDPYVKKGDASSGLLPGIEDTLKTISGFNGTDDDLRIQSFNFRLCLTHITDNLIPFAKPSDYKDSNYELLLRFIEAGHASSFTISSMPNHKTDSNSEGHVSLDFLGGQFNAATHTTYPEATYSERDAMITAHKSWQQGFMWTIANHPRVPKAQRDKNSAWGYAKDEFTSNSNWPYGIYVREARRMKGLHVMTQQDIEERMGAGDDATAGMGAYSLDSHVSRRVVYEGQIYDEGGFYIEQSTTPYVIPYGVILPQASEAVNFLNPVTISATHVALGSIRMEPVYMILGQTAGTAAALAIDNNVSVQDVDRHSLNMQLLKDEQRLTP